MVARDFLPFGASFGSVEEDEEEEVKTVLK